MSYFQARFALPADQEDLLSGQLLVLGALGLESTLPDSAGKVALKAFFDQDPRELGLGQLELDPSVEALGSEAVPERDWLAEYRAAAAGRAIGTWPRPPLAGRRRGIMSLIAAWSGGGRRGAGFRC